LSPRAHRLSGPGASSTDHGHSCHSQWLSPSAPPRPPKSLDDIHFQFHWPARSAAIYGHSAPGASPPQPPAVPDLTPIGTGLAREGGAVLCDLSATAALRVLRGSPTPRPPAALASDCEAIPTHRVRLVHRTPTDRHKAHRPLARLNIYQSIHSALWSDQSPGPLQDWQQEAAGRPEVA